jgi:class 3 adenylate cyclase/tetratricopeptide (TPR) repeat protein
MCGSALVPMELGSRSFGSARMVSATPVSRPAGPLAQVVPAPAGEPVNVPLSGERRVASVIFADVKGSTELLERIGTEAWVEIMNDVFQILEAEIYRYGGEVGQFRGDGLVAFFGTKLANEDDPERAVHCALAMQNALKPYAAELSKKEGNDLSMRVGVNTGEVIVANVGDEKYSEDTAMGEALTVASRMETSAEAGTILVSDNTFRLVRNHFEWLSLGEIPVKGMSHPMPVYRPLAYNKSIEPEQDLQDCCFTPGVIGREKEQKILKKSIEDLHAGRGGIVLVTGVKGMGKSFMVNQLRQHFMRQNALLAAAQNMEPAHRSPDDEGYTLPAPVRWLRGRSRSYGHLRPYSIWLDLLQEWLATHPQNQAGEATAILRTQIDMLGDPDVEKDYPNLATFLSTPIEETATERLRHMDAEGMKRQFFLTVRDWIQDLARQGPLVISIADVQWADSTSLELLDFCLPLCDTGPILWLLVYRLERDSAIWEFQHQVETNYPHRLVQLPLPPLTNEESEEFIDKFLGKDVVLSDTRRLLIGKSEGNPYFIKELIFSLIAQGVLEWDDERSVWKQVKPVTSLDLPDSLQGLLMARIDRLSPGERSILQLAAVIGSVFWLNALQALATPALPLNQLQSELVALQRAGLIHQRAYVEDLGMEYAFDSSLIREVAYESLLNTQRVAYHLKVAEYLENIVFQEGKRRYFNTLAHHYCLAGNVKKELFYTLQAAEHAQHIYANVEALRYYTRALELLQQMENEQPNLNGHQHYAIRTQKFEALNGRRAIHFLMGNLKDGWEDAKALLPLARLMDQDPVWLIDALLQQPGVSSADSCEELEQGVPLAAEALNLAIKLGDKRREMSCLLAMASQTNLLNDPSWVSVGDRALALSREIGDRQYEAMILLGLGHAYVGRDELEKGMGYLNAALPICQALDDRVAEMTLLRVTGSQFERSGDHYRRLVEHEQKRMLIAREIGDRFEEANSLMFCGQIQALNLGDLEGGLKLLHESLSILDAASGKIFPLLRTAQIQIALGQFEDAQQALEMASPVAEQSVYDLSRVGLKIVKLLLYNALGDITHLNLALDLSAEIFQMEINKLVSRQYRMAAACESTATHLNLARVLTKKTERTEHLQQALESSRIAVEIYNSFGYVNIIECASDEILFRRSQALAANGFQSEAAEYLEMAYAEMMRKYNFIPPESYFRQTYVENIAFHREIRTAYAALALTGTKK